jgi:short-subunit dehydrogenase
VNAQTFRSRYGPTALVLGASEGLGAEFGRQLAGRGLDLVLVARREGPLQEHAGRLRSRYGVRVTAATFDLASADVMERIERATGNAEIGFVVYNAAASLIGPFLEQPVEAKRALIDVNCRAPLEVVDHFAREMAVRGRGGIVLMSSLAASQGSPRVATYAATKAFDLVLAEGLWQELGKQGVDIIACRAGATRTPGFEASGPRGGPAPMQPRQVVAETLRALGHQPSIVPGRGNRLATFAMGRLLTRRGAVRLMGTVAERMYR